MRLFGVSLSIYLHFAVTGAVFPFTPCQQCNINTSVLAKRPPSPSLLQSCVPDGLWKQLLSPDKDMFKLTKPLDLEAIIADRTRELQSGSRNGQTCVRFISYCHKRNCKNGKELRLGDSKSLAEAGCSKDRPTLILLHGWLQSSELKCFFPWAVKDFYCRSGDYNVIMIDYSKCPGFLTYILAVCLDALEVATKTVQLLGWMGKRGMVDVTRIWSSGISLGAQFAAAICNNMKKTLKTSCKRLTALDPAGPCYDWPAPSSCCKTHVLSGEDADYVECIHTNAEGGGFGMKTCRKNATNFFINGGKSQCYCTRATLMPASVCSHIAVGPIYTASLYSPSSRTRCACTYNPISYDQCRPVDKCCNRQVTIGGSSTNVIGDFYVPFNVTDVLNALKNEITSCTISAS